jgi:hypothetical protein
LSSTTKPATEKPPKTGAERTPEPGAKRTSHLATGGMIINVQLALVRELKAKLAEEYRAMRLLRASIAGEALARGERVCELGKKAHECINATSMSTTQTRHRA